MNESCLPCSEMEPEPECYLFIHNDEYFHGCIKRTKPVGEDIGYWRCNGKEEAIFDVDGNVFAYKVHYTFFADGKKTHWKMEEYRLLNNRHTINDHDHDQVLMSLILFIFVSLFVVCFFFSLNYFFVTIFIYFSQTLFCRNYQETNGWWQKLEEHKMQHFF